MSFQSETSVLKFLGVVWRENIHLMRFQSKIFVSKFLRKFFSQNLRNLH